MNITLPFRIGNGFSEQGKAPGSLHVPMVYEQMPLEPVRWEYYVLTIDTREMDVPDATQLNKLGDQGWLLVGTLNQSVKGKNRWGEQGQMTRDYVSNLVQEETSGSSSGSLVHYYFVRQKI